MLSWIFKRSSREAIYVPLADRSATDDGEPRPRIFRSASLFSLLPERISTMALGWSKGSDKDVDVGDVSERTELSDTSSDKSATFNYGGIDQSRFYRPIDSYEGIHRWDPNFEWEPKEEKQVIRRVSDVSPCPC